MLQRSLVVESSPLVEVAEIHGDLRVAGWERAEILAKTNGDSLELNSEGGKVLLKCNDNLILYMPSSSNLHVESVAGDASLQALQGEVEMGKVSGDLTLHGIGSVRLGTVSEDVSIHQVGNLVVEKISGDLTLRGGRGDCTIGYIEGDASVRDVEGTVTLDSIQSNLFLRNVLGSVTATTDANASIYLKPQQGREYRLSAGDDLLLRLPSDSDVELHLLGSSPEAIHVDLPGVSQDMNSADQVLKLGNGAARMIVTARDDLVVTSHADRWDSVADFGVDMGDVEWPHLPEIPTIPNLPDDLQERINRDIRRAMERARSRTERASRHAERARAHAEAASRRAGLKVEAAMRRAEVKLRAAQKHVRGSVVVGGAHILDFGGTPQNASPVEPVSEEERLVVLRLLQQKKISLEEAENLLAALEGKTDTVSMEESAGPAEAQVDAQEIVPGEKTENDAHSIEPVENLSDLPQVEEHEPVKSKKKKPKKKKKEAKND